MNSETHGMHWNCECTYCKIHDYMLDCLAPVVSKALSTSMKMASRKNEDPDTAVDVAMFTVVHMYAAFMAKMANVPGRAEHDLTPDEIAKLAEDIFDMSKAAIMHEYAKFLPKKDKPELPPSKLKKKKPYKAPQACVLEGLDYLDKFSKEN